jgi:hypothetical protein
MDGVLARVRESKRQWEEEGAEEGRIAGEDWVKDHAVFAELRRLDLNWGGYTEDARSWMIDQVKHDNIEERHPVAFQLVYEIQPENDGDPEAASEFWGWLLGDYEQASNPGFFKGFISGALNLWAKLEPKL